MTAKEYLSQYRRYAERIRQIDLDIERLEAEAESISIDLDGMPHGTTLSDRTGSLATRLADLRSKKLLLREEAWEKREEIEEVIQSLPDPVMTRLLYDRYIIGMRWEDVARDLNYDDTYTRSRLHGKALMCITIHHGNVLRYK